MVDVNLKSVFVEDISRHWLSGILPTKKNSWYALVALDMVDNTNNTALAEWYYIPVCSPEYAAKYLRNRPKFLHKCIVSDHFSRDEAFKIAKIRFSNIKARDWDNFLFTDGRILR